MFRKEANSAELSDSSLGFCPTPTLWTLCYYLEILRKAANNEARQIPIAFAQPLISCSPKLASDQLSLSMWSRSKLSISSPREASLLRSK